jgi:protease I
MAKPQEGKKIAILATDGVEQSELTEPRKALEEAGANTVLISPTVGTIQAMNQKEKSNTLKVNLALSAANPDDYDGLLLPGGVANPDELRTNAQAVTFVRAIFDSGKPVAAICHGPRMVVEADVVRGRMLTSWPSLKTDIRNAAGIWVDREVVRDGQLITSRKPDDIPVFVREMLGEFGEAPKDSTNIRVDASPLR